MTGGAALTARSPVFDALPSERKAGREASANGPSSSKKVVSCWEEASRLRSAERLVVGHLAERLHRRLQLLQEAGQLPEAGRDVAAALGRGLRGLLRLGDEAPDVLAVGGEVADDLVGVDRQVGEDPVLRAERGQHLVGLAQRRAGAADRRVEAGRVARHAGAELSR